jgi:NADH-quinone oxidoreductase subunit M
MQMPILSLITWVPLAGVLIVLLVPKRHVQLIRSVAAACATVSLVLASSLFFRFDRDTAALQFTERREWIPELGMTYVLGVDGLSFPLLLLATLLSLVAVIASFSITERVKGYFAWLLLLEFAILGVFVAQDWFLFYVFWEMGLVPMFFLIGLWGGDKRNQATMSFFLYTLGGSIFMLLGIIAVYLKADPHTFDMIGLMEARTRDGWDQSFQRLPFLAFFIGFAVKIPAFPLHGWLPLAHVEAPTPVSIMLSGVLLKLGAYGLLRVSGLLPQGLEWFAPALLVIGAINIIYGALLAWRQTDLKAMVAYSSIDHMGFVLIGIAALNIMGFTGALLMMLTHGVITGALFFLVGVIYERAHTRELTEFGGLAARIPLYSSLMSLALLASMGLPGLAQFVSELHVLIGAFQRWGLWTLIAGAGILITAAYSLRTIGRMFMGPLNPRWAALEDISVRELVAIAPLTLLMVALGVFPSAVLNIMDATLTQMAAIFR